MDESRKSLKFVDVEEARVGHEILKSVFKVGQAPLFYHRSLLRTLQGMVLPK